MRSWTRKVGLLTLVTLSLALIGATSSVVLGQETDDPQKIAIYQRFYDNQREHESVAYQAAREYLQKYANDKDRYIDYLTKWVALYEREDRKRMLPGLINEKNYVEAYKVGARVLADEPDYLRAQIDLGYAGYLAFTNKVETYNADALAYGKKAIAAIESGKEPTEWAPFKGKDDTLAALNFAMGVLSLKSSPEQTIDFLLKALQYNSNVKATASTYYYLAVAYESGPYRTQSTAFQAKFANKPETPESQSALLKLNALMDRIVDAYARAIAATGNDPAAAASRQAWMVPLTNYYKFRHDGTDTGLTEFIATALSRPVPPKP